MVFEYFAREYGWEACAHIATYGFSKVKGLIRDIGRVLKIDLQIINEITKPIPNAMPDQSEVTFYKLMNIAERPEEFREDLDTDLPKWIKISEQFRAYMEQYPELCFYLEKLGGAVRTYGVHAAAVVISPSERLDDWVPLQRESDSVLAVTQFNKKEVENLGLLKLDILGLSNLNVIDDTIELIKETEGIEVDLYAIPRNDDKVFKLLRECKTHGVFQLGGGGITAYTKQVAPTSFAEIIDILALNIKPGRL